VDRTVLVQGSVKRWDILEYLHNWWLHKKGPIPYIEGLQAGRRSSITACGKICLFPIESRPAPGPYLLRTRELLPRG
jgi:hypothetical protein